MASNTTTEDGTQVRSYVRHCMQLDSQPFSSKHCLLTWNYYPISPLCAFLQPPNRLTKYRNAYADEQYIPDVTVDWMYRPHTLTAFAAVIGAILYLAWNTNSETASTVQNTKTGILAAVSFIIILGMIAFPSGPFIRPHPIMWRIVFAVAVCYEIFLIMILFQVR